MLKLDIVLIVALAVLFAALWIYGKPVSFSKPRTCLPALTPLMITPEQLTTYDDRPWRPFRWPYHQTMSIFKLDLNHWLDMDRFYSHYLNLKQKIFSKWGTEYIDWLPESYEGCLELMETVRDHLVARYPLLFTAKGDSVYNEVTHELVDMLRPLKRHPLEYVARLAKEDFYIVRQRPDGRHYLVAAAVAFPGGGFGVRDKIGKHLDIIHTEVPYYKEKLQSSMEKWFSRLRVDSPVERASWLITWDHQLRVAGIYDLSSHYNHDTKKEVDPTRLNIRIERQALRRLPKSKVIVFSNHPLFYSIEEMKDEPMVPSLIKKIITEGPEKIVEYKNFPVVREAAIPYLDKLIERQLDLGLIAEDNPHTLPTYPFAHWIGRTGASGWDNPSNDYSKSVSDWATRDYFDESRDLLAEQQINEK